MSQLFESGGQSIEASASVLPMNISGWFPLRLKNSLEITKKSEERKLQTQNRQNGKPPNGKSSPQESPALK